MALATLSHRMRTCTLRIARLGPATQLVGGLSLALAVALAAIGPARLIAQIEGDRGIPPVASSTDIQVTGIEVNTTGKDGEEAREAGWKEAQRKAWEQLKGPKMSDAQIDAMVTAVVIEREQIGPHRYVARLGVIFDRTKAGQLLVTADGGAPMAHSAPLLIIPVLYSGGTGQVYEVKGLWQRAWANFGTAASPIDYVRPAGSGGESLIITAGQPTRRSRLWWRNVLDQFGAADVIMPMARLERQWPGGPVKGTFTARYGPDNTFLDSFTLTAPDDDGVPKIMNEALVRLDLIYRDALAQGTLQPDPTLYADQQAFNSALAVIRAAVGPLPAATAAATTGPAAEATATASAAPAKATVGSFTVQFASPDARAVDAALAAVRGVSGVQGASTSSIAIGGTSVMRVTIAGDIDALAAGLRARGYQVTVGSNALRISR